MTENCGRTNRNGEPCQLAAGWGTEKEDGPCKFHGGVVGDGHGAPEGNTNAADHGAYAESFVQDFLRDDEIKRVEQMRDILDTPEGAKEDAKLVAAILKEQWRRTGDERFARRYESVCDTFGLAPNDEVSVSGEISTEDITIDFNNVDT